MLIAKHLQQLNPARSVWQINADTPVKPPNQRRIQCACTAVIAAKIGGGHHKHRLFNWCFEAIHLRQQCIQDFLSAVMKSFLRSSAANGINFIDKQNRRRIFSCNRKYSVHSLRSLPNPFADKLISRSCQEGYIGFRRYHLGQRSLSGSRRSVEQNTLWCCGTFLQKAFGIFQIGLKILQFWFYILWHHNIRPVNIRFFFCR